MCTWTQKQNKYKLYEKGKVECLDFDCSEIEEWHSVDKNDTTSGQGCGQSVALI